MTGIIWKICCLSKGSQIKLHHQWWLINSPVCKDKYVFLDRGGKLWDGPDTIIVNTKNNFILISGPMHLIIINILFKILKLQLYTQLMSTLSRPYSS